MNNYLNDVRKHLAGIPAEDVNDLLEYYEEYFYDAGMTDADAYTKYGRPKKFAQFLRMNYLLDQDDARLRETKPKHRLQLVWVIVLGLFASPILLPLAIGAAAVIFGLLIAFLAIVFSVYVVVFSLIAAGLASAIVGSFVLLENPATSFVAMGVGLAALGIGLVLAPFLLCFTRLLFSLFMRFVKWLGRKLVRPKNSRMKGSLS